MTGSLPPSLPALLSTEQATIGERLFSRVRPNRWRLSAPLFNSFYQTSCLPGWWLIPFRLSHAELLSILFLGLLISSPFYAVLPVSAAISGNDAQEPSDLPLSALFPALHVPASKSPSAWLSASAGCFSGQHWERVRPLPAVVGYPHILKTIGPNYSCQLFIVHIIGHTDIFYFFYRDDTTFWITPLPIWNIYVLESSKVLSTLTSSYTRKQCLDQAVRCG